MGEDVSGDIINLCKVNQYIAIDKLKFHPNNPRTIKPERLQQLKDSIIERGFYQPILVWKKGGIVLAGNHRLKAAQELVEEGFIFKSPKDGEEQVLPVVIEDVDARTAETILFESNNHYAEWVEDELRKALKEAEDVGRNISSFGFDQSYIDNLLATSLKDAEEAVKASERSIEPVDGAKLRDAVGEKDELCNLVLGKDVYEQVTELLGTVAKAINKDWKPGDSYDEAAQAMCQLMRESGALEDFVKASKKKR